MSDIAALQPDKQRLTEAVTQFVIDRVAERVYRPGDQLPSESELAKRLNVSKPVVREALGRLSALGIVQIQQGKPTTVKGPSVAPPD
eukprot:gene11129-14232_t